MLRKMKNINFDVNIALETVSIILKTTVLLAGVTTVLLLATILKDVSCLEYHPNPYEKTVQEMKLEEEHEQAVRELFAQ